MRQVQQGDADAFAELYDRHAMRAFRVARAVCRDAGQAEDAVQDGFLAIWRSRASYQAGAAGFQAWAMRIVRNRAIDSIRRAEPRPQLEGAAEDPAAAERGKTPQPSSQDLVTARDERLAMVDSVRRLPPAQAEVVVLAFYGELTHSEIATQLDLPPGTVKGRMRLGLQKLRREMTSGE